MVDTSESGRVVAWAAELRAVHQRLRAALEVARDSVADADPPDPDAATRDLLLYCRGFCAALGGHHTGEDTGLFPAVRAAHPELVPALAKLTQDHDLIATLLTDLERALSSAAPPDRVRSHLDGLGAIMESHFAFEERELLGVLETLELDAEPSAILGPL